jgi:TPR repeat protein
MLEAGDDVGLDLRRAAALYQRACDLNDPRGCARLGSMYQDGRGVNEDRARADALFSRACFLAVRQRCQDVVRTE